MKASNLEKKILSFALRRNLIKDYSAPAYLPSLIPLLYVVDARHKDLVNYKPELRITRYASAFLCEAAKIALYGWLIASTISGYLSK